MKRSAARPLAVHLAVPVDPGQAGFRAEGDRRQLLAARLLDRMQDAQVFDDRLAFRGVVGQRGQQRALGQFLAAHPRRGIQRAAAAVAEGDGAGLVEQQHVDVAGRLHRATGLGDHVQAHQAVHAGDADGREQAADGGRDQRHQQRHQEHQRQVAAGEQGERLEGHHYQQEDQGQADQQDVQRHFVGGLLPLGAFHQGDHPVQGRLARVGADTYQQPVGHHLGVAGHRRAIAAGLADHRRRFAGDGGLVDRRHAFDDFAVAGNHLAGLDPYHIALAQAAGNDALETAVGAPLIGGEALAAGLETVRAGLATSLGERFGEIGEEHGEPQPEGDLQRHRGRHRLVGDEAQQGGEHGGQFDHQHHRRAQQLARVELDEGLQQRRPPQGGEAGGRVVATFERFVQGVLGRLGLSVHVRFLQKPRLSCSAIGPRARVGRKVRPPTSRMVTVSRLTNSGPWVGKLFGPTGLAFFAARLPAMARIGRM